MNAGFKANKQLWYGAAGLFVTALVTKQLIWASLKDFIETRRSHEHESATLHLERIRMNAESRRLDPLTAEQKTKAVKMITKEEMQALQDIDKP